MIPSNNLKEILNVKVGNTFNYKFIENISQGTKGVPLKAVIKWFIIPITKVVASDMYKLSFIFPVIT